MKKALFSLASLLMAPLAAQAELQSLADEDLSAVHAQGLYSLKAGNLDLYTVDTTVLGGYRVGPVQFSSLYNAVNDRNPEFVDATRGAALNAANAALAPANVALGPSSRPFPSSVITCPKPSRRCVSPLRPMSGRCDRPRLLR